MLLIAYLPSLFLLYEGNAFSWGTGHDTIGGVLQYFDCIYRQHSLVLKSAKTWCLYNINMCDMMLND